MPVWSMDAAETTATLAEVQATKAHLVELEARLLSHADRTEVAAATGATSTANWHAHATTTTRVAAHRSMRLAQGLEDHDAKALKHLGRHILEVACPEAADAHEAALLEREERDAAAATRLTMYEDGHGKVHGRFTLDTLAGAMLKKHLYALAAPKHRASQGPLGERRPTPERLGQAFVELIQRYPTKRLPKAGGLNATIVVLMHLDTLMGDLKAARLDTGETISPGAPAASRARPGSSPPSSTASPRSSTWAARSGSTARANGSPRPSKPAAAKSKAATHHPARPTCTT